MDSPGFAPGFWLAEPASSCWTMSPFRKAEAVGLEPTSGAEAATCFQDRLLIRPDDFRCTTLSKFRGLESNQRPPGSEPGVTTSSNCPGSVLSIKTRRAFAKVRGEGFEPPLPGSKPGGLPLADPRVMFQHAQSALRESNPPGQLGRLAPLPLGQGHVRKGGRRGSRTLKAGTSLDCFRDSCHRQLACPSVSSKLRWQESNLRQGG